MKVSIIEAPKWIVKKMDNPSKVGDLVPLWLRKTPDESTLSMNPLPQIKISQPFKTIHAFAIPKNSSHSFEPFIWGYHKWGYPIDHPIFLGFSHGKNQGTPEDRPLPSEPKVSTCDLKDSTRSSGGRAMAGPWWKDLENSWDILNFLDDTGWSLLIKHQWFKISDNKI